MSCNRVVRKRRQNILPSICVYTFALGFSTNTKTKIRKTFFENKQKKKKKNSLKAAMSVSFHTQQRLEIKLKKNQAKINPVKTFVGC